MEFKNVARFFDRDSCYDGYSGALLFQAQLASYDSSQPDGTIQRRRTLSLAPDLVASVPSHRVLTIHGDKWLLGTFITDGFYDEAVRSTASAKFVTGSYQVLTPAEAANHATTGRALFASVDARREYLDSESSEYLSQYVVNVANSETALMGKFLRLGSTLYHVRSDAADINGHLELITDAVEWPYASSPLVTAVTAGTYDPILETSTGGASVAALAMPRRLLFRDYASGTPKAEDGDSTLLISKLVYTPKVGESITISGQKWIVQQVIPYYDAWAAHIRRV